MKWLHRIYYAIQRRKFGESYGCGRCHHAVLFHTGPQRQVGPCTVYGCPCAEYRTTRLRGASTVGAKQ